ncbi:MAG TPA: MFS transporter [Candidatus Saccharimonadales bacterium]|nr:MFS transporter [Candidatus Saccharimonadales bacterium]
MKQRSPWLIFILVAVAQFMVVLDISITNVALPTIKQTLHFDANSLQWVITAYALTFGGFLLLGGRAADLFGRRKTLLFGMLGFTLVSFLIGISQSAMMLIILRAVQGIAAAFMSPSALSIVLTTFKEGSDRNKALGYWSTVATGGAAVGLLLGGFLTQYLGWRWNFFINVPVGIIISYLITKIVPLHESEAEHNDLDLPGAVLVTGGLIVLVFLISMAPVWGIFSLPIIGLFILTVVLLSFFIYNESKSNHPLMPLSIFKNRNVVGANLVMAPVAATMFGNFFLLSLYIQTVMHYSPVITGLSFLPFPIIMGYTSTRVSGWVSKYGFKRFLIAGPIVIAISIWLLSRLPVNGNYFINVLPSIILMPFGIGMTFMPVIVAATSGVRRDQSGLASGLISTAQQMGGALGLAILAGVAAGATASASQFGKVGSLVFGYDKAFLVGVFFMLFALLLSLVVIKQKNPNQKKEHHSSAHQQISFE